MSDLYILGQTTSKSRGGNSQNTRVTGTRDGAIYVVDYALGMALEGRVFHANVGTLTTPITFGAYTAEQPELVIDVPSGTTIIPVYLQVHLENSAGTDTEIIALTANNNVGAGTSTTITPLSTRTDRPVTTNCSVYSAYSGNGTAPTGTIEFWRWGDAFADAATKPPRIAEWNLRNQSPQIVVGTGSLVVYVSATSTQADGFIKVSWIEVPSSSI